METGLFSRAFVRGFTQLEIVSRNVVRYLLGKCSVFLRHSLAGFTLIELGISLGIMGIMMAILLSQYPETAVRLTLINASHKVSLLLREAQVRGSAVDSGNLNLATESPIGGYGIYVTLDNPSNIILFADSVDSSLAKPYGLAIGDGLYQDGAPVYPNGSQRNHACENNGNPPFCNGGINETSSTTVLPTRYIITKLCILSGSQFLCNTNYNPDIVTLTVSFTRPNPQPAIYINGNSETNFSAGCIELQSPRAPLSGHTRAVYIYNSGMIRTQSGSCG